MGTTFNYFIGYLHQSDVLPVNMCTKCGNGTKEVTLRPRYVEGSNGPHGDFAAAMLVGTLIQKKWINVAVFESDGVRFEPIIVCKSNGIIRSNYKGPEFLEMVWEHSVPWIEKMTTAIIKHICPVCKRVSYDLLGTEQHPDSYGRPVRRRAGQGLFVHRSSVNGIHLFKSKELGYGRFCTSEFKERIESLGLTNITFWESGTIVDD